MNTTKFKMLFLLLNVLFINTAFSQNDAPDSNPPSLKKNVVYGTVGVGGISVINGNYERMIFVPVRKQLVTSLWLKFGYGAWVEFFGDEGKNITSGLGFLTGSKKGHFEFNFGFTSYLGEEGIILLTSDYGKFSPAGSVGFRFQKPEGSFVFRTGIGFPDFLYLSAGFAF